MDTIFKLRKRLLNLKRNHFCDFKAWVFENVFENIESKVKWVKAE